jgi:hypothetical protein
MEILGGRIGVWADRGALVRISSFSPVFGKTPRQFSLNDVVRRINAGFHKITVRQYKNILIFSRITPDAPEKQGDSPFRHDSARVPTVSARLAHDWRGTT